MPVYVRLHFKGKILEEIIQRKLSGPVESRTLFAAPMKIVFNPAMCSQLKARLLDSATSFCILLYTCSCGPWYGGGKTRASRFVFPSTTRLG